MFLFGKAIYRQIYTYGLTQPCNTYRGCWGEITNDFGENRFLKSQVEAGAGSYEYFKVQLKMKHCWANPVIATSLRNYETCFRVYMISNCKDKWHVQIHDHESVSSSF